LRKRFFFPREPELVYLNLSDCENLKKLSINGIKSGPRKLFVTFPPGDRPVYVNRAWDNLKLTEGYEIQLDPKGPATIPINMNHERGSTCIVS